MILTFPDLDTLRLALTTGTAPSAATLAPALVGVEDDGRVWIQPSVDLAKKAQADLRKLGANIAKTAPTSPGAEVSCWLELFPLARSTEPLARPEQTPVLFELSQSSQLTVLVTEILRLGNDRQGYRWLDDAGATTYQSRALLRVVGPPYYSLLRALERDECDTQPVAYVEQVPRVWVQFGYKHPFGEHLKPPAGKLLFLRPPRRWTHLDDAPFRDIYEVLEFALPEQPARWQDGTLPSRIVIPLRLTRGGSGESAEMWVLRDDPVNQLDELVRNADDHLLARLAFAVGEQNGKSVIVLRVRPSRLAPPELVINATGFRHHLKLPNLFVPIGRRLQPPLRRDAVRKHLADDPAQVTWLQPDGGDGFTPESLPETAFRPLSDWIDYVLDRDRVPLQAWVESATFDFEHFVCDADDGGEKPPKPPKPPPGKMKPLKSLGGHRPESGRTAQSDSTDDDGIPVAEVVEEFAVETEPAEIRVLREQRATLEKRFLDVQGSLDVPERTILWPQLAALNARLGDGEEASLCWLNALWLNDESLSARALNWFRAEASGVEVRKESGWPKDQTWASRATLAAFGTEVDGTLLDRVLRLDEKHTTSADVRALAAYVYWASCQDRPPESLLSRLGPVKDYLEIHDARVPVRAMWLAALGLTRLAGGDTLALARTRDRLLERLYSTGLRPEQDLPSFLRVSDETGSNRFRIVRRWLSELCEKARRWVLDKGQSNDGHKAKTHAYSDLLFSFGLARLGEVEACHRVRERAKADLTEAGEAHEFLLQAFDYRISQALEGKTHCGPLPTHMMEYLAHLTEERKERGDTWGTGPVYLIDCLRRISRILEPDQEIEPYRHAVRFMPNLERDLGELPDILDREEVAERVRRLLKDLPRGKDSDMGREQILRAALDQAPRVGEKFAVEMVKMAPAAFDARSSWVQADEFQHAAKLLEKGMFVASHFNQAEVVQQLVARFRRLLESQRDAASVHDMDKVGDRAFRGLRKMRMHKEIEGLLQLLEEVILKGQDRQVLDDPKWRGKNALGLRAMLQVAANWYYAGKDRQADAVIRAARAELLATPQEHSAKVSEYASSPDVRHRTALARAYATALSQAPIQVAQHCFEELFEKLEGIRDVSTTNDHYSQLQIQIIEAVVLAIVSESFTVGTQARRWLDDDEFLVRRRIHHDVRTLVGH
jgi:hypothetical protein